MVEIENNFFFVLQGKQKADKNRLRVEEEFLKSTHHQRAEAGWCFKPKLT